MKYETNSPLHFPSCSVPNLTSELFTLQPNFTPIQTTHTVPNNNNAWGGRTAYTNTHTHIIMETYSNKCPLTHTHTQLRAGYAVTMMRSCFLLLTHFPSFLLSCYYGNLWTSGDLLKPAPPTQIHSPGVPLHSGKMLPNDLDSSLANLVGSECTICLSKYSVIASIFSVLPVILFSLSFPFS